MKYLLTALTVSVLVSWLILAQQIGEIRNAISDLRQTSSTMVVVQAPTPVQPSVQIIPIEPRPLMPSYPSTFSQRKSSSVLTLVRRGKSDGAVIAVEREIGAAVAVTSDGWIATSRAAIEGLRLVEIGVERNGRVYPVKRGLRDSSTDIAFLKIDATDLPSPAFARADDVQNGAAVWFEARPGQLRPDLIIDMSIPTGRDNQASEKASRRFLIQGEAMHAAGGAVWDGGGKLVGITENGDTNGLKVIPAEGLGAALTQIISDGEILRPLLGIRGLDLSDVTLDTTSSTLPSLGTWVKTVAVGTPAYRILLENDVIERVERDILDGKADLGERLQAYRPGATLTFYGKRKGTDFQARITLGSQNMAEIIK